MAAVGAWFVEHILPALAGNDEPPREKLRRFARKLAEFYQNGERPCLTDVFSIGEADAFEGAALAPHTGTAGRQFAAAALGRCVIVAYV